MLGLKLRPEFGGTQTPGTVIDLRRKNKRGGVLESPYYILEITYPTADVQTALKAISKNRVQRPIVLIGERGRGKSHIMAVMHHAMQSAPQVEPWARDWGERIDSPALRRLELEEAFFPITEPVHNHEYPFLWDLLFDRHPRGDYFKGKFDSSGHYYPSVSLMLEMFAAQPVVLILDEFQKWFDGLPETDQQARKPKEWASNFIQNLSEISVNHPDLLILVVSVLNNQSDAYRQIHRNGPILIDFSGPTARRDRQKMVLHRLFKNRAQIPEGEIRQSITPYAQERFRLRFSHLPDLERERIAHEVMASWPFAPELLELLSDQILMAEAAQHKRDLIRILAQVYQAGGEDVPLITPADFSVNDDRSGVQSLLDSIATVGEQEQLREVALRNLEHLQSLELTLPHACDLVSALWMRSMSPGKNPGGTRQELQLDITRRTPIDNNAFQHELNQLIENSINIHGENSADGRLYFALKENPRVKVRTTARNNKLWQLGADSKQVSQMVYPGKDIEHVRNTLRHLLIETNKKPSQVIVLGPNWQSSPWQDVIDIDQPNWGELPVLIVLPTPLEMDRAGHIKGLGEWLAQHVSAKRNTVRFLLPASDTNSIYQDAELLFLARASYLTSQAWRDDPKYKALENDFDKPLRHRLKTRFERFAILRHWNYPQPAQCVFEVERVGKEKGGIPAAIEQQITRDLFDPGTFRAEVEKRAQKSWSVGDLLDELAEPPASPKSEAIPFLGDTIIYEKLLELTAKGHLALNVNGKWIGRPADSKDDQQALRYVRSEAFRSGNQMRQILLGGPENVSSEVISSSPTSLRQAQSSAPSTKAISEPITSWPSQEPGKPKESSIHGLSAKSRDSLPPLPPLLAFEPPSPAKPAQKHRQASENSGINLSGHFEKWGISNRQKLDNARIEFNNLSVQQLKQILQRIPPRYRASLEIIYTEGYPLK